MSRPSARLRVHQPPDPERVFTMVKDVFTIGRRPDNDLVLAQKDISRLQAVISRDGEGYVLEDRGSTFGTDLNGSPVTRHRLRNRDVIKMGRDRQIEIVCLFDDRISRILEEIDAGGPRPTSPDEHRKLGILLELSKGLDSMTSLQDMLELALDAVLELTHAERGFLMLRGEDGELRTRAARNTGREAAELPDGVPRLSHSIVEEVVASATPCFLADVKDQRDMAGRTSIAELSLRSVVCLPLKLLPSEQVTRPSRMPGGSEVFGVIYADSSRATAALSEVTRDLILSVVVHTTFALENFFLRQEDLERRLQEREMERVMERLREMDRLKTEFLSNVSHELKTPLTAIKGAIDNMLDGLTGDVNERQRHYLQRIGDNASQLDRLISDLLDLARIESGRLALAPRSTSLNRLLEDAAESMRPLAERREIVMKVEPPGEELVAHADRDRLMQVLFNLMGNAVKFTRPGGTILLAARREGDDALIGVSDTGPGLPERELERIFDRFYQVASPSGEKASGTGLGLPIARSLVEQHGGRLWAENTPTGSRFLFTLPLATRAGEREAAG